MTHDYNTILAAFGLSSLLLMETIIEGHLNQTYRIETQEGRFVLQRINTSIFTSPQKLMSNIAVYLEHRTPNLIECPAYLKTQDGLWFFTEHDGSAWRIYPWIEGRSLKKVSTPEQAYECGLAYGLFNASARQVPPQDIQVVIPDFFNLTSRLSTLEQAVKTCSPERLSKITPMLAAIETLKPNLLKVSQYGDHHHLPKRCMHGDTKPSNVLFHSDHNRTVGVIDLDTICVDYLYFDFGDGARSTANVSSEDDLEARIDLNLLAAFTQGYIEPLQSLLTPQELDSFIHTLPVFSFILCVRFATDYCQNDTYFRVSDAEHNLRRTQTQFAISQQLMRPEAMECVRRIIHGGNCRCN